MTRRQNYQPVELLDVLQEADQRRARSQQTEVARATGKWGVGPSNVGSCRRQIQYRENPPEDYVPEPENKAAAYLGSIIHEGIADALRKQRRGRRHRRIESDVVIPGLDVPGHVDLYERPIGRCTDWKSLGEYGWSQIADGAREDDIDQVQIYGLGLASEGEPVNTVRVTYIRRSRPSDVESFEFPYDEARAHAALDRLHGIIDMLDSGVDLPRDRLGPTTDPLCRSCPAVRHCWNLAEVPAGRSPESWLLIRDDEGVAAALAEYVEAREAEKEPKARKEYAAALLRGVEWGEYDGYTLAMSRPKPPPPEPDLAAQLGLVTAHLDRVAAGLDAPMRSTELPQIMRQPPAKSPALLVGRVRAATKAKRAKAAAEEPPPVDLDAPEDSSATN